MPARGTLTNSASRSTGTAELSGPAAKRSSPRSRPRRTDVDEPLWAITIWNRFALCECLLVGEAPTLADFVDDQVATAGDRVAATPVGAGGAPLLLAGFVGRPRARPAMIKNTEAVLEERIDRLLADDDLTIPMVAGRLCRAGTPPKDSLPALIGEINRVKHRGPKRGRADQ